MLINLDAAPKSDECSIPNSQFPSEGAAELRAVLSDKNWEFGIEHSSDPFVVSLRLCEGHQETYLVTFVPLCG
jgi:hypothetical protein